LPGDVQAQRSQLYRILADDGAGSYDCAVSLAEIKQLASQLPQEELTSLTAFLLQLSRTEEGDGFNGAALSESVLTREWNSPEEDEAWANL